MNLPVGQSSFFSHPWIQALDYLPIASTVTNAVMIVHKTLSEQPQEPQPISFHAFRPLVRQSGSYWRNIILLLPFFGNFFVAIYDAYAKYRGNQLLRRIHTPLTSKDIKKLRSAASYGNLTAITRLVKYANLHPGILHPTASDIAGRFGTSIQTLPPNPLNLINQCLAGTHPDSEKTLLSLCNSLALSCDPNALEMLGIILKRGNEGEKKAAAISVISKALSTRSQPNEYLEHAIEICSKNLEDRETRKHLIRLFKTEPYDSMKTAFDLLSIMSQRLNDEEAFSALGERYLNGPEKKDPLAFDKAIANLQAGSNFYLLGLTYKGSFGHSNDKAFKAFLEGAKRGDDRCKVYLAECFLKGWGVAPNREEGERILKSLEGTPTALQYETKIQMLRENYTTTS